MFANSMGDENAPYAVRPKIVLPRTALENTLEFFAILGLIFSFYLLFRYYSQLPEQIPNHFGVDGQPDSWSGRELLILYPVISLLMFVTFALLERFPGIYNYPYPLTPKNIRTQYALARLLLGWLNFEILWLLAYIEWKTIAGP